MVFSFVKLSAGSKKKTALLYYWQPADDQITTA